MSRRLRILQILNIWRLFPVYMMIFSLPQSSREIVLEEIHHWKKCDLRSETGQFDIFCALMLERREYRTLLQYRLGRESTLCAEIAKLLFPGMVNLSINTAELGRRFFLQHGFSTVITAKSIGSDCWVNQQVTIGYTFAPEPPVIGNGVTVCAGAKVLGQITIGDNAIIGANAVVVKNVAENAVMGGVPAKVIGENINHKLYPPASDRQPCGSAGKTRN